MNKVEFKFKNGDVVKDIITGFTGTITSCCYNISGLNDYVVTAKPEKEGKEPNTGWYDEQRLVELK